MSFPISNSSHSSFLSLGLHTLVLYFFVSISVLQIRTSIHFSQILHMFINTQHLFFSSRLISVCVTLSRSTHASKDDPVLLILWLSFRKGRGTRDQTANIRWIIKKKKESSRKKKSTSALLTMSKSLTMWITTNCGKSERDRNTRPPDLTVEKPVCRSESNSQNWTWNNRLVSNRKRSMSRLYIVTLHI